MRNRPSDLPTPRGAGFNRDEVEAANWLRLAATQGENLAQMVLGAMYVDGRGVLKDYVLVHMWLNIASANGLEEAREHRDRVEAKLTRTQILRATELARACLQSNYQTCNPYQARESSA